MQKRTLLLLLLFLINLIPLTARGAPEKELEQNTIRVFLVLPKDQNADSPFVERYTLPTSLSCYAWSEFSVGSDGISTEAVGGYRIIAKEVILKKGLGRRIVYGYDLRISAHNAAQLRPKKTFRFTFDMEAGEAEQGDAYRQPPVWALLAGIRRSEKQSGLARVAALDYLGKGRFKATVEVR